MGRVARMKAMRSALKLLAGKPKGEETTRKT